MLKKKYMAAAVVLAAGIILNGCSVSNIPSVKEMMVGIKKYELDYDPVKAIALPDYKGIEVDCTVSDEEVQTEIDNLLEENKLQVKEGTCKKGDTVNIDYSGKKDGKKFDGGTAEDQTITLGESGMIDGFDDAIIGMKVGEKKNAKMRFPKPYEPDKSLAGKEVVFTIKLNYISKDAVFDDAFVAGHTEYKTVDEYKKETRNSLAKTKKDQAGYSAFEKLMEEVKVDSAPKSLSDKWEKMIRNDLDYQAKQYGMDVDTMLSYYGQEKETYVKESLQTQLKQVLAVESIIQQEEIEFSDRDIKAEIETACKEANMSEGDYRKSFDEYYQGVQSLEEFILFNLKAKKVVDILKENAKIKE